MANNFDSNVSKKVMRSFLSAFESERVLTKNINTQLFQGEFDPSTDSKVYVKRPTDYRAVETVDGDVSAETENSIITGQAFAEAQNVITVFMSVNAVDQALRADQLDQLLAPAAKRLVTKLETNMAAFMLKNTAGFTGTGGTAVTSWDHVADAGAHLEARGVPMDKMWCYGINPFTQRKLASDQRSLGGETGAMTANQRATIATNFAGMDVKTCTTLSTYSTGAGADRAGVVAAVPTQTYLSAKDTMTTSIAVSGFNANLEIKAGETITISGIYVNNLSTRLPMIDDSASQVEYTATVTADVTLDGAGAGTIVVTGPAINEADGQYDTIVAAIAGGEAVTLTGSASTIYQPNLAWHPDAFSMVSIPQERLSATDTIATTEDGIQIRVTRDSDFYKNKNMIRFDLHPAFAVLNPYFAVQSYGTV